LGSLVSCSRKNNFNKKTDNMKIYVTFFFSGIYTYVLSIYWFVMCVAGLSW
jgi:hypothetical protein